MASIETANRCTVHPTLFTGRFFFVFTMGEFRLFGEAVIYLFRKPFLHPFLPFQLKDLNNVASV